MIVVDIVPVCSQGSIVADVVPVCRQGLIVAAVVPMCRQGLIVGEVVPACSQGLIVADVALSSDFIAGFCGETEADHEDSVSLLRLVRYHRVFHFPYSLREVRQP